MSDPIKTPTDWRPSSGLGTVTLIGMLPLVENATKLPIVENATKLSLVTTPTITTPKNPTGWTKVG